MAELVVATATASQIARSSLDITRACASAGAAAIAREGVSLSVLGYLAASTCGLLPNAALIDGLTVSCALEEKWTSHFMANLMGAQENTTQHALLLDDMGKKLVLYATALAAAATSGAVRGILRQHLSLTLGLKQVAEVPENIYHVCVHHPTLQLLQQDTMSNFERCSIAFSETDSGTSNRASYKELATIAIAFGTAQKKGPSHWVRVKNLVGVETLCAALATAFIADITVGVIHAIVPPTQPISTRSSIPGVGMSMGVTSNQPGAQHDPSGESALSTVTPTSIRFEYDTSGVVAIGVCEMGAPIRDYIVPEGGRGRPFRNSMLAGEVLALAKIHMNYEMFPWICKGAVGAHVLRNLAKEIVEALEMCRDVACKGMMGNLVYAWIERFVKGMGGLEDDVKVMHHLLIEPPISPRDVANKVELLAGPEHAMMAWNMFIGSHRWNTVHDILVVFLLEVLFGSSYSGLELQLDSLGGFSFPPQLDSLIPNLFRILPAYNVPIISQRPYTYCCSAVQCGGYVLMPRILAEEKVIDIGTTPFIMIPGRLAKDGVPVEQFIYEEQYSELTLMDLRPGAPVPSNAGESDTIDFSYQEAEYGFQFYTVEAGHRLNLDGLIRGILFMHKIDDSYGVQAPLTDDWRRAAPHHTIRGQDFRGKKTIFLTYNNNAGRRLALSRVGDMATNPTCIVHAGRDIGRALAYANQYGRDSPCEVIIL